MPVSEVPAKIGYPLDVRIDGATLIHPLGQVNKSWPGDYEWIYVQPGLFGYLEVSVTVSGGTVSRVDVEYDDVRVYSTSGPAAPAAPALATVLE